MKGGKLMAKKNGGKIRMLRKGNDEESIRKGKKKKKSNPQDFEKIYTNLLCCCMKHLKFKGFDHIQLKFDPRSDFFFFEWFQVKFKKWETMKSG